MLKHKMDKTFSANKSAEIGAENFVRRKIFSAEILSDRVWGHKGAELERLQLEGLN